MGDQPHRPRAAQLAQYDGWVTPTAPNPATWKSAFKPRQGLRKFNVPIELGDSGRGHLERRSGVKRHADSHSRRVEVIMGSRLEGSTCLQPLRGGRVRDKEKLWDTVTVAGTAAQDARHGLIASSGTAALAARPSPAKENWAAGPTLANEAPTLRALVRKGDQIATGDRLPGFWPLAC